MAFTLVVLAGFMAVASAGYLSAAPGAVYLTPATSIVFSSHPSFAAFPQHVFPEDKVDTSRKEPTDPRAVSVYETHKAFLKRIDVQAPYAYSYGYEYQDDNNNITRSQYESRYGDVAVGTATEVDPKGRQTVVFYTVDSATGFNTVIRNDSRRYYGYMGYARIAAPISYASHPAPEVYAPHATLYPDPNSTIAKSGPPGISAYRAHVAFLSHTGVEPPYKYSWGYEVYESVSGRTKSQYESYYGDAGEGNFALVEPGGRLRTIDYTVDETGFSVATPVKQNTISLVYN